MPRKRSRFVIYINRRPIHVLKLGGFLFALLLLLFIPLVLLNSEEPTAPITKPLNNTSEFVTKYDYPFTSISQRESLENQAYLMYAGTEIYEISPDNTGVWPSGYGQPISMSVFFPPGALSDQDPDYMFWTDPRSKIIYSCYRGIPVPRNNASGLNRILGLFGDVKDATILEQKIWDEAAPVMVCFGEGTEPNPTTVFLDVLGVYRYNSDQTEPAENHPDSGTAYPMVLVGSADPSGYDQIAAPARSVLRSGVNFQRGDLNVTINRVELAQNSTRIRFTVINGTDQSVVWNWRTQQTFLLLDGTGGESVFPETAGADSEDELPTTFGPARTEGTIFFPRIQEPQQSLEFKIVDPADPNSVIEINFPISQLREVPAAKRL